MSDDPIAFGPFVLDPAAQALTRNGERLQIGLRGYLILAKLLEAPGKAVGKDALIDAAWPGLAIEESNLTVQIAALRKLLGENPDGGEWIETIPRVGYRFSGRARQVAANLTESGLHGQPAVAVLPFENLSADPEQGFLADGIVEEIITALSRFRTFAVVARNSTFAYKGRAVDVREVARDLGVRYVLQGSVRRSGDRVRVAAQLIEGVSGAHLRAGKFEGAVSDIFDFQDQITRSVIGFVEPRLQIAEIERARRKRPESLDAWDLYIQAMPLVYGADVSAYSDAIDLLDRALILEPDYGPAMALASWAHEKRKTFGGKAPPGVDDADLALAFAQRALDVDPDDALAMALLGWNRILFREDRSGLELCTRALDLNPNNKIVLDLAAVANIFAGDLALAIACATRATELSPVASDAYHSVSHVALAHLLSARFEEAAVWSQRSIDLEGNFVISHILLAVSCAHLGRLQEARAAMTRALAIRPDRISHWERSYMLFPERSQIWIAGLRMAGMPET